MNVSLLSTLVWKSSASTNFLYGFFLFLPVNKQTLLLNHFLFFFFCFIAYEIYIPYVPSTTLSDGKSGGRHTFQRYLSISERRSRFFRVQNSFSLERDLNQHCATGAVLYQLKSKVNWELVILWVNDSPYKMKHDPQYICNPYIFPPGSEAKGFQ